MSYFDKICEIAEINDKDKMFYFLQLWTSVQNISAFTPLKIFLNKNNIEETK